MLKLYDNPLSPYARKVRLALYEKGLEFEKHEILTKKQRDQLLAVSPRGEVPSLVDDGTVIYDSAVICAYLEDRYPEIPLLPAEAAERARCRRLEKIADSDIDMAGIVVFLIKIARPDVLEKFPALEESALRLVEGTYAFLARELGDREFFAGDAFSLAEATILPHLTVMLFGGYPIAPEHAKLVAWLDRMNQRPSVQRDLADAMAGLEASRTLEDPIFDNDYLHWRDVRIEGLIKVGLGSWLLEELDQGRAFLPPLLGAMGR